MDLSQVDFHLDAYKSSNEVLDGVKYLVHSFGLESDNLAGFGFRDDEKPNFIVVTTEGEVGEMQTVMVPKNILNFDTSLILNLIAHEMLHVRQKSPEMAIEDKNEREFQAYYEMLFHKIFPKIPDAPDFNTKQFAENALMYYRRMGEGSDLQKKYAEQKKEVEDFLAKLTPNSETSNI